jgi:hypothetical protein
VARAARGHLRTTDSHDSSPVFFGRPRVSRYSPSSSRSLEGSGAPADAEGCEPSDERRARPLDGTLARRPLAPHRNEAPPGAPQRRSATDGPRFRERGPATPVSQLLAPGPIARERSPAIARVLQGTFPRNPRRRISRRRGFPPVIDPVRSRAHLRPVLTAAPSSRRPMTTPLEEHDRTIIHIPANVSTVLCKEFVLHCANRHPEERGGSSRRASKDLGTSVSQRPFEGRCAASSG